MTDNHGQEHSDNTPVDNDGTESPQTLEEEVRALRAKPRPDVLGREKSPIQSFLENDLVDFEGKPLFEPEVNEYGRKKGEPVRFGTPEAQARAIERKALREEAIRKLKKREIDIVQFFAMAATEKYKVLGNIKMINLIAACYPGWTVPGIKGAFNLSGIPTDVSVKDVLRSESHRLKVKTIVDSSPKMWQHRIPAPPGWPWRGNILASLQEIDPKKLPDELAAAVRYTFDNAAVFKTTHLNRQAEPDTPVIGTTRFSSQPMVANVWERKEYMEAKRRREQERELAEQSGNVVGNIFDDNDDDDADEDEADRILDNLFSGFDEERNDSGEFVITSEDAGEDVSDNDEDDNDDDDDIFSAFSSIPD